MEEHYKELFCVNDHQNRDFENYTALFDCMIDPVSKRYLSEDYAFCRRWQQLGGKIHAHINTTLGHVGNLPFSGTIKDRVRKKINAVDYTNSNEKQVSVSKDPTHDFKIEPDMSTKE